MKGSGTLRGLLLVPTASVGQQDRLYAGRWRQGLPFVNRPADRFEGTAANADSG